jgi:tRNA(Met) C34 N-acetyltransferase TmcA
MPEYNLQYTFVFQYIHPTDAHKLGQAELLVIDEAAAIPLPYVKSMLGPYLVFLASTINGLVNSMELKTNIIQYMFTCE